MTPTSRRNAAVAAGFALFFAGTLTVMGQSYKAPRTPWGDPDLQGTYTNSDESGISMEKPAEFAGKRLEEVTPAQLAELIKTRRERQLTTAQTIGGSAENDTGAGPPHWYENYNATNSRAVWSNVFFSSSEPPGGV